MSFVVNRWFWLVAVSPCSSGQRFFQRGFSLRTTGPYKAHKSCAGVGSGANVALKVVSMALFKEVESKPSCHHVVSGYTLNLDHTRWIARVVALFLLYSVVYLIPT